jgi:hypothetical protein
MLQQPPRMRHTATTSQLTVAARHPRSRRLSRRPLPQLEPRRDQLVLSPRSQVLLAKLTAPVPLARTLPLLQQRTVLRVWQLAREVCSLALLGLWELSCKPNGKGHYWTSLNA